MLCARALVLSSLVFFISACSVEAGYFAKDRLAAEKAVSEFRRLNSDGNFEAIYNTLAADEMKGTITIEQFVSSAHESTAFLGSFKSTVQAAASCFPHQVRFVYLTEFEKAKVTELMSWSIHEGKATLLLYKVSLGQSDVKNDSPAKCPS